MSKTGQGASGFSSFLPKLVGFGSIILLIGGFAAWAMRAEIDGAVVASGRIVVERNRQAIQHLRGGVVKEIFVKEGDTVTQGALLVQLDPTLTQSELTIVEGQLYELMARRGRLEAERDEADTITFDPELVQIAAEYPEVKSLLAGQERLFAARLVSLEKSVTQLNNQKEQLENQIGGIDAQMEAIDTQLALLGEELDTQEMLLEKGLAQTSRVLSLHREGARLAGLTGDLSAQRAQAKQRIAEISIQELRYYAQRREDAITMLRDLHYSEMELAERRRALLTQLDRMDLRAPVSGVVYDMQLFGPRSVIKPAEAIMFIVPQDRPLVIEAEVKPIDVDKVFTSQEVVLRFSVFDMRSTPDLFGTVKRVSPDAFTNQQSGLSYYRAEIELPSTELEKLSDEQILIPGMPVDTFFRTGSFTPATYLTSPLGRYFQKAMRDEG